MHSTKYLNFKYIGYLKYHRTACCDVYTETMKELLKILKNDTFERYR